VLVLVHDRVRLRLGSYEQEQEHEHGYEDDHEYAYSPLISARRQKMNRDPLRDAGATDPKGNPKAAKPSALHMSLAVGTASLPAEAASAR
jgi:hypothetical protein